MYPGENAAHADRRWVLLDFADELHTPSKCTIQNTAGTRTPGMIARRAEFVEGLEAEAP